MIENEYFYKSIDVLKSMYKDDMVAMSHIIIAESEKDIKVIKAYLDCVLTYIEILKNNL